MAGGLAGNGPGNLSGETDLATLLATIEPMLDPRPHDYVPMTGTEPPPAGWLAIVREDEGIAVISPCDEGPWARITLTVHSSLDAVGLTAAVSTALATAGLSANMIAGLHHDHILVPWPKRHAALEAIRTLETIA